MCAVCDAKARGLTTEQALEELRVNIDRDIAEQGVSFIGVPDKYGDGEALVYSVGMANVGLPDIVVAGLNIEACRMIAQGFYHMHKDVELKDEAGLTSDGGIVFQMNAHSPKPFLVAALDTPSALRECHQADEYYVSRSITPKGFVQVYWADQDGRQITDKDYDEDKWQRQLVIRPFNIKLHAAKSPGLPDRMGILDAIKKAMGGNDFDPDNLPDPQEFVEKLRAQLEGTGVKIKAFGPDGPIEVKPPTVH